MEIQLIHNSAFKWTCQKQVWVKGYAFTPARTFLKEIELADFFDGISGTEEFLHKIKQIEGCFSIVIENKNMVLAATDQARSFPLFYSPELNIIADSIPLETPADTDPEIINPFLLNSCVYGAYTLAKNWKQLNRGELLEKQDKEFKVLSWYKKDIPKTCEPSRMIFETVLDNITERLISSCAGRTILVPLSGGLDSRLIAAMLKKKGHNNVICFTYGKEGSPEAKIASKVSYRLGFKHYFIPYTPELFEIYFDRFGEEYIKYSFNHSSLPQEQDIFALQYLKEKRLVPEDSIIVPGYCGDFPAGSYLPNCAERIKYGYTKEGAASYILHKYLYNSYEKEKFTHKLKEQVLSSLPEIKDKQTFIHGTENWHTDNKLSKYVVNGVRAYEFLGFEWRLPLWDKEFLNFFLHLNEEYRREEKFYREYLSENYFKPYDIDFFPPDIRKFCSIKVYLKTFLPKSLRTVISKMKKKAVHADRNNLTILRSRFKREINEEEMGSLSVNYYHAKWLVKKYLIPDNHL